MRKIELDLMTLLLVGLVGFLSKITFFRNLDLMVWCISSVLAILLLSYISYVIELGKENKKK